MDVRFGLWRKLCRIIDAFELWCWRRLLRVSWNARRSNQSILKEISPGCSLEGLMLKLKLQFFGHLMRRTDSLEKTLIPGKIVGRRRRGWQKMSWLVGIIDFWTWVWGSSKSWWWTRKPGLLQSMESQKVVHNWVTELNWTDTILLFQPQCVSDSFSLHHPQHWVLLLFFVFNLIHFHRCIMISYCHFSLHFSVG